MKILPFLLALATTTSSWSQTVNTTHANDQLRTEILKMDSLLFSVAFNQCDTIAFKSILADNIEFYDDRTGLNTSKEVEIKALIEKCARKDNLTRVLKSTSITKLGEFGAVQLGEHEFVLKGVTVGSGQFIHIWERTPKGWKLRRIVSYEHASTGK